MGTTAIKKEKKIKRRRRRKKRAKKRIMSTQGGSLLASALAAFVSLRGVPKPKTAAGLSGILASSGLLRPGCLRLVPPLPHPRAFLGWLLDVLVYQGSARRRGARRFEASHGQIW